MAAGATRYWSSRARRSGTPRLASGGESLCPGARPERVAILYRTGELELTLHQVSSMVAELAPLDLWIEELLEPGDLLIIDEPEAHLHPESQRRIATVLVRLVNAGVNVLCTTHSAIILHQISNHILSSPVSSGQVGRLGFTEHDILDPSKVGVYLFRLVEDGSEVKQVKIESGFGISEDEFVRVAEAIGDQTYCLQMAQSDTKADE